MIWAAIGVGYRSRLHFIERTADEDGRRRGMDSTRYIRLLSKELPRMPRNTVFQQDGARSHTSKQTLDYLKRKGITVLENWAPYSPDLAPIENLWPILDRRISDKAPRTLDELKNAAITAWNEIPQSQVDNFVLSFEGRIAKIE